MKRYCLKKSFLAITLALAAPISAAPESPSVATVVKGRDGLGILLLPNGSKFKTTIYGLKVIESLRTTRKLPYFILSGRGCDECDMNKSIYIHSPSDGPMKDEAGQRRFDYPGRGTDYQDHSLLYESRMLIGDCVAGHPNAVIWFERFLGEDWKWHSSVTLAEVKADRLVIEEAKQGVPTIREAEQSVRSGPQCREVAGIDRPSEP